MALYMSGKASYLLRFDDLCPTMNWRMWEHVEQALLRFEVRPVLAVIPDNWDPELRIEKANAAFWDRVRTWQERGWTIGLHGYRHEYVTSCAGLIGKNRYSEFAGLSRGIQTAKLRSALKIFSAQNVRAEVWIAPAHSFDETTLDVLKSFDIKTISDGYFLYPGLDHRNFLWVPQQIWSFAPRPAGIWTVCLHHNQWNDADLERFRHDLQSYRPAITDWNSIIADYRTRRLNSLDRLYSRLLSGRIRAGKVARLWMREWMPAHASSRGRR